MTDIAWHTLPADETARLLNSDLDRGLGSAVAAERLTRDGLNALVEGKERSAVAILVYQFRSLIVGLLLAAGGVALALGEVAEALAILVVILLNAIIGFATEWRAGKALAGLRKQAVFLARVLRDGVEHPIPAENLVLGDVVLLAAGDRVPADGRVFRQASLQVDEAMLTGESLPVNRTTDPVMLPDAPLADRINMVHRGTGVTAGRGAFIVTATGVGTELGRIGALLVAAGDRDTPLEAKLTQLSRALLVIVLGLCGVITLLGWLRGNELFSMIEVGISLAIAAVPEGLLAVTTLILAVGTQRMARMNALIRRLPAVVTLGSTTVICTDKTGTLTCNEMTVGAFQVAGRLVEVTGSGYGAEGEFRVEGKKIDPGDAKAEGPLHLALHIGALCNDAQVNRSGGEAVVLGDPTEAALVVVAEKAGFHRRALEQRYPRIREIPFHSDTRRMVTVHRTPEGGTIAYAKGSPAAILAASEFILDHGGVRPLSPPEKEGLREINNALAASALRVLGLSYRDLPEEHGDEDLIRGLTFVGLVGMNDPLRGEARETIATCRKAGIRAIMITGDQQITASEIARQLGLELDPRGRPLRTIHARELEGLDEEGWGKVVLDAAVFARVSPEHKLRIVDALQRQGHVVAMTGDGVNDAPALRKADIGIAMGIRGTEVAKDSADMVITDDDFSTIVGAIEQGRIIVHNILRFIHYLFSSNLGEITTVFAAILMGWPLPLGVLQILWLNLVTDIFPAMALALEPSTPGVMEHPPRNPKEPLLTRSFGWMIAWQGALLGGSALAAFAVGMRWYGEEGPGLKHAVTLAFMTLAMAQVFHAFSVRSRTGSAFTSQLFINPWLWGATGVCVLLQIATVQVSLLQRLLHTVPLTPVDWGLVGVCSLAPVAVVEWVKGVQRWRSSSR